MAEELTVNGRALVDKIFDFQRKLDIVASDIALRDGCNPLGQEIVDLYPIDGEEVDPFVGHVLEQVDLATIIVQTEFPGQDLIHPMIFMVDEKIAQAVMPNKDSDGSPLAFTVDTGHLFLDIGKLGQKLDQATFAQENHMTAELLHLVRDKYAEYLRMINNPNVFYWEGESTLNFGPYKTTLDQNPPILQFWDKQQNRPPVDREELGYSNHIRMNAIVSNTPLEPIPNKEIEVDQFSLYSREFVSATKKWSQTESKRLNDQMRDQLGGKYLDRRIFINPAYLVLDNIQLSKARLQKGNMLLWTSGMSKDSPVNTFVISDDKNIRKSPNTSVADFFNEAMTFLCAIHPEFYGMVEKFVDQSDTITSQLVARRNSHPNEAKVINIIQQNLGEIQNIISNTRLSEGQKVNDLRNYNLGIIRYLIENTGFGSRYNLTSPKKK